MKLLKGIGKVFFNVVKYILLLIAAILVMMLGLLSLNALQAFIFVPEDFIMWSVGDFVPTLAILLPIALFIIYVHYLSIRAHHSQNNFFSKHRSSKRRGYGTKMALIGAAILLALYFMVTSVSIIYKDTIVTHGFFYPQGKTYGYGDIQSLHTGTYNSTLPFIRYKGEFYYVVELKDGKKINLASVGGVKDNEDSWLTIMELDAVFVELGVPKTVDAKYKDELFKSLDQIYRDRISKVFENVR